MKIILLSTFYKPSVGGVERQVEEIFTNLTKKGVNVEVYTTDASHGSTKRLKASKEENVKRFRYLFGFGYFFRFSPLLVLNLLTAKFDVIHVHNSHDAHLLPVILIKLLRGKKLVITGHNPYVVDDSKRKARLSKGVKFFDSILRIFSFAVDSYIALLNSEKEFVSEYLNIKPERITVIPNGIRDDYFEQIEELDSDNIFVKEFKLNKSDYKLVLGCLCRMDYVKGIQNLLKSAQDNKDCLFIFAGGDGGYLEHLKELYKDCNNVLFTERYIDVKNSMGFYAFIDVFLLPSIYEPFGITLVEAMTQGKYIIATNKGGAPEIINNDFGTIIDPLEFNKWSEHIKEIKLNKDKYIKLGKNGIAKSFDYKWATVIDQLISEYKRVL